LTESELDCQACGLCCRGRPGTVLVSREDLNRWRRADRKDLEDHLAPGHFGDPSVATDAAGTCVHLSTQGGHFACRIYAIRPQGCADFEVGGSECLATRRRGRRD
jgi:Fe-S-cluster containining protein